MSESPLQDLFGETLIDIEQYFIHDTELKTKGAFEKSGAYVAKFAAINCVTRLLVTRTLKILHPDTEIVPNLLWATAIDLIEDSRSYSVTNQSAQLHQSTTC